MAQVGFRCLTLAAILVAGQAQLPFPLPYQRTPPDQRKIPRAEDFTGAVTSDGPDCCRPGQSCWPSAADVMALTEALDPTAKRHMHWDGKNSPLPAPLTTGTNPAQPLCGLSDFKPLYERTAAVNSSGSCVRPCSSDFCSAATRNDPAENWNPAFIVFPVTAAQVQVAVRFARKHSLCVAVVGTGHDFLNRHSCNNGLMIRTNFLNEMDWSKDGVVKLGSGLTFSDISKAGSEQTPSAYVSTGWAGTVGVAGWSIGGGHGPNANANGIGVDNVLGVEIVTADGNLITANSTHNTDLFWALKGGGGSTWGVMTALYIKKHITPPGGFSSLQVAWLGRDNKNRTAELVDQVFDWALGLDEKWSGLHMWQPVGSDWGLVLWYWYQGNTTDEAYQQQAQKLLNGPAKPLKKFEWNVANWWAANPPQREVLDPIEAWVEPYKSSHGVSLPSAILSRETVGSSQFRTNLLTFMTGHPDAALEVYHDIGHPNVTKHRPANSTSISQGFQDGMLHVIIPSGNHALFTDLSDSAYFSESAYSHPNNGWKKRYWGSNYDALMNIKTKYDPDNLFWCKECVGSDLPRTVRSQASQNPTMII